MLKAQQGYLLVETLIAVGILAVGLLGVSAMQVTSLKSSYSAVQRGQAAYLIAAMTDSMRANPLGVSSGAYNGLSKGTPTTGPRISPAQVAKYDFDIWHQAIDNNFPHDPSQTGTAPQGNIICPITGGTKFNCILEINWIDTRADSALQDSSGKRYKHITSVIF